MEWKHIPHECCGALLGETTSMEGDLAVGRALPLREVVALFPLTNRAKIAAQSFFTHRRGCARRGESGSRKDLDVVGWYI